MRIVKKPDVRRNEILDAAEALFGRKGYAKTTINDILTRLEIAKGTFYHYFTSKEELMAAIVARFIDNGIEAIQAIADDATMTAPEKLRLIITAPGPETAHKDEMVEELHAAGDAELHLLSLVETVRRLTPVITGIVEQGVREGVFTTPYPREVVELLLTASQFLLDTGIFPWTLDEQVRRARALSHVMESALGAPAGTFDYIHLRYEDMARNTNCTGESGDAQ
ncbi:MAG: TetR/AcrR family transcriptional regulator [Planctomycetes bacterium]|nr:TetR/AcrR family transcriptional regulator [Planctomycetota bacterium]